MPAAQVSGTRRRRAPRVIAVLGLALVCAALVSVGSASADATDQTTSTVLQVSPSLAAAGAPVTLTATVTGVGGNPPGSVLFSNGTTTLGTAPLSAVGGSSTTSQAVLVTTSAPVGSYGVTATYNSTAPFSFFTSTSPAVPLTITGATIFDTTTTLSANPPTVDSGQPVTLTALVSRVGDTGIPTGDVRFTDGGVLVGHASVDAGTATLISTFTPGLHTIVADYSGDSVDQASGSSFALTVTGGSHAVQTTTTVTATPSQAIAGSLVSFTAHVVQTGTSTPPPAGALVTFRTLSFNGVLQSTFLGEAPLVNGSATLIVGGWLPGQYVIGADYAGDITDLASSGTVPLGVAPAGADLSVTATAAPATAHTGGQITYSLVVANGGGEQAQNVVLTDQLPAGTSFVSVAPGSPTCAVTSGLLSCSLGAMANGAQQTVTLVVAVGPGLAGTTIADTAQVTSSTTDPNTANNTSTATTLVRASADVQVTQTGPASVVAGAPLAYTITVKNAGPDPAASVALSDALPAALTGATATTTAGTCSIASGTLSCPLGTIASGGTVTVNVAGTISAGTTATSISNTASATSATDDPNPANNAATVVTAVTRQTVCSAAGNVYANQDFKQVVGRKSQTVHVETNADCDLDWKTGAINLHYGRLLVTVNGQVLINAGQSDITQVNFTSAHDAVIVGTYAGTTFTVTLHDGGCSSGKDSVRVQYGSFDTATLTAKHGDVHINLQSRPH